MTSPQPLELEAPSEIPVNLVVSGQISLDVNNLVSNFDLDTNELGIVNEGSCNDGTYSKIN